MEARPSLIMARAVMFTAVCLALGAAAHTLASGMAVPVWTLPVAAAALLGPAAALAVRERSLPAIVGGTVVCEAGLHELFMYGQVASGDPMAGHADMSTGMLLGHLVSAVLTGWWLRRGERAAWALLRAVHRLDGIAEAVRLLWRYATGRYATEPLVPRVVATDRAPRPRTRVPRVGPGLRGPPRPIAPAA